ncbi:hypothetical protein ACRYJU_19575 [Alloalcanivorax xenomutans]|uniref:hypothetical protein n=1 Tax=Alloalcanivorax xenomutans TaxID=1094342 RepID=UPI003D9BE51B
MQASSHSGFVAQAVGASLLANAASDVGYSLAGKLLQRLRGLVRGNPHSVNVIAITKAGRRNLFVWRREWSFGVCRDYENVLLPYRKASSFHAEESALAL